MPGEADATTVGKEYTSIRITPDLADELHDRKNRGDSYEDVIWRSLEKADKYEAEQAAEEADAEDTEEGAGDE